MKWINNYQDSFEIVNLGWNEQGRGPFLVRQDGRPPSSDHVEPEGRYFLMKDGCWMLNVTFCNLSDAEQRRGLFQSISEIHDVVGSLPALPICDSELPEGKSHEELIAAMSRKAREFLDKSHHSTATPFSP